MMTPTHDTLPCLPESAPFTIEQRAYLNGFLAGLLSRTQLQPVPSSPMRKLVVGFGSQTGNCEVLAKRVAKDARAKGFEPTLLDLADFKTEEMILMENLVVITSTYGDGDPPDNARELWDRLNSDKAPDLSAVRYALCALGDTSYSKFCQFGRDLDQRLETLGARKIYSRVECDVDYEETFEPWLQGVLNVFSTAQTPDLPLTEEVAQPAAVSKTRSGRTWYEGRLKKNRLLNKPGSAKEVRHFEIAFDEPFPDYETGDALGVQPWNCELLVEQIIQATGYDPSESVQSPNGDPLLLSEVLRRFYDLNTVTLKCLKSMMTPSSDEKLKVMIEQGDDEGLKHLLTGWDVLDCLDITGPLAISPGEWVGGLRKLQPRLYSISSSPLVWPDEIHLTVGAVRYKVNGRERKGVCSTYLADRVGVGQSIKTFLHKNKAFRLPVDQDVPLIMVGPGTGIAPFRAFLHERRARGSRGDNWLFFGDQKAATDFLYREELEMFHREGLLKGLDLAWSRESSEKLYVQHLMDRKGRDIWDWLERGAAFYVCGDASRMAKDVDAALKGIIKTHGCRSDDAADDYLAEMKKQKRYCRDVY